MKKAYLWIFILFATTFCVKTGSPKSDWLIDGSSFKSEVIEKNGFVTISNGLISRTFSLSPDGATTGFSNLMTGNELIRAVKPEAIMTVNGNSIRVGGLTGQPVNNYLAEEWIASLKPDSLSPLRLSGYETGKIVARFDWKKRPEWMAQDMPWPPSGKRIDFTYIPKENSIDAPGIKIVVHYEIYDGIPLICKWVTVINDSEKEIIIDSFISEILALTEEESAVGDKKNLILSNLYVETDYAFGGSMSSESCYEKSVWRVPDPDYKTIVNYNRVQPSMLECRPMTGPAERVEPGKSFDSFRTWILVNDSSDRERKGLATTHPGHEGLADSQWKQFRTITDFYKWCRARGVYLTVPDWYFLNGSSKTAMGYRESNWSLPRRQQEIIERQNIFDGTWEKTPSMGWMHVPLVEYQGGGREATIEPLKEHLPHYGQRLADLFGAGVQAAYRGSRLYDAPETLDLVKKWVSFYKKHRAILDADIIHLKRADGRGIDAILHVNPSSSEKGLLMVYNPLDHAVKQNLTINVYYTGLSRVASINENDGKARRFSINRNYEITIPVNVEPNSQSWYIIK